MRVNRTTVDLSGYPDLVVIYLGMRVRKPRGILRLLGLGPKLYRSHKDRPDGLLLHEDVIWSLFPPHWGARQYWRDLDIGELQIVRGEHFGELTSTAAGARRVRAPISPSDGVLWCERGGSNSQALSGARS